MKFYRRISRDGREYTSTGFSLNVITIRPEVVRRMAVRGEHLFFVSFGIRAIYVTCQFRYHSRTDRIEFWRKPAFYPTAVFLRRTDSPTGFRQYTESLSISIPGIVDLRPSRPFTLTRADAFTR